jgi:hypothetical protein
MITIEKYDRIIGVKNTRLGYKQMMQIKKGKKWIIITDLREFTESKIQEIKSQLLGPNNKFRI